MADSKRLLEQKLGINVNCLAYPYGVHSDIIRKLALESGYEVAFGVYGQKLTFHSPAEQLGRYAIGSPEPKGFQNALKMSGGGTAAATDDSALSMNAGSSMITVPMQGETISDPKPLIKANLAIFGEIDPKSAEMRIGGIGIVPAKYDPATNTIEAKLTQKLRARSYTVIVSGTVKGRKVQANWSFNFDPTEAVPPVGEAALPPRPAAAPGPGKTVR